MSPLPSFDPGFSTEALTGLYSPEATVDAFLQFEEALALALADAGIAPREQAEKVAAACRDGISDPEQVMTSSWETGTPIIALRESIEPALDEDARDWFHFGATSQDTIDTAQMLQARSALELIDVHLVAIALRLRDLTREHKDRPQMGRTFLQDARPTTFGFRTATWLDPVLGHIEDLRRANRGLTFQLGGPVGTLSDYGDASSDVLAAMSRRTGLKAPDIAWHSNRSTVLDLAHSLERTAITMAKIGSDVAVLASSAISEVTVRAGGSSSMPEKRNPVDTIRAVAATSVCSGAVGMLSAAPPHQLDRAVGAWHVEWVALPLAIRTAGAAVEAIQACLDSLEVDDEAMATHVSTDSPNASQIDAVLESFDRIVGH